MYIGIGFILEINIFLLFIVIVNLTILDFMEFLVGVENKIGRKNVEILGKKYVIIVR